MDRTQLLIGVAVALFSIGLVGVIVRRNVLVMLMCMELMLNGVNLSLVTFAQQTGTTVGAVLVFLVFVVATVEIALAIPIVLLLVRDKRDARHRRLRRAEGLAMLHRDRPPALARLRAERHPRDPPRRQRRRQAVRDRGRLRPADRLVRARRRPRASPALGGYAPLVETAYRWAQIGDSSFEVAFYFDRLAAVMALVVTGVGSLIHVYSVGYMKDDPATGASSRT